MQTKRGGDGRLSAEPEARTLVWTCSFEAWLVSIGLPGKEPHMTLRFTPQQTPARTARRHIHVACLLLIVC